MKSRGAHRKMRLGALLAVVVLVGGLLTGCNLPPDVALGGSVTTGNGAGVGQVTVSVFTAQAPRRKLLTATTSDLGQYEFKNTDLDAGTYRIRVGGQWHGQGATTWREATPVTVSADHPTRLNLTLADASDVTGTLVDADHNPAPGTVVAAYDNADHVVGLGLTGSDGTFDVGVPPDATVTIKLLDQTYGTITLGGTTPSPITPGSGATMNIGTLAITATAQIAAGRQFNCSLKTDTTVACWGYNGDGELGDGTTTTSPTPVTVQDVGGGTGQLTDVTQIAAGYYNACALKSDTTVVCWGSNDDGELGDGTTTDSPTPVKVKGVGGTGQLTGVTQIAARNSKTCAVLTGGTAVCWGHNGSGELGDGTTTSSSTPVVVKDVGGTGDLTGVTQVVPALETTCAIRTIPAEGSVVCWGSNYSGELGDGSTTSGSLTPVVVKDVGGTGQLTGVTQLAGGYDKVCALRGDATVVCWGSNGDGDLGNGGTADSSTPVVVKAVGGTGDLTGATQISANCAVLTGGTVACWGYNGDGQVGDGTNTDASTPVMVKSIDGTGHLSDATQVVAGGWHTCALLSNGTLDCWGQNIQGQLGDGTTTGSSTPVAAIDQVFVSIITP